MMGHALRVVVFMQPVENFKEMITQYQDVRIVMIRVPTVETFKEMDLSDQDVRIMMGRGSRGELVV